MPAPLHFGYNPPSGTRGVEQFPAATFVRDLQNALDVAAPAFDSFWVSDHLMTAEPFRMEVWTQLTWIAPAIQVLCWAQSCWRTPSVIRR